MVEDIGKIISNGFGTYTKNINLSIPFVLDIFITGLLAVIMFILGLFYIFSSSLSSLKNASPRGIISIILPVILQHILEIVLLIIVFILISTFVGSFFTAGAIGMAKQATESGASSISTMVEAGKKNVVNLFLAEILVGLLSLAGIVFIVPGAMKVDINQLLFSKNMDAILLLLGGFLLWLIYLLILSLMLAVYKYALVVEGLGPVDGIVSGFKFFNNHRLDVFLLWLITGIIVVILAVIEEVMGFIPVMNIIWPYISLLLSFIFIPSLTTLWWVRLYMTRTDKKL